MAVLKIDELNIPRRSMPYSKYFGEMVLTKKQKEQRTRLAIRLEDIILEMLETLDIGLEMGVDNSMLAEQIFMEAYLLLLSEEDIEITYEVYKYIEDLAHSLVTVTLSHRDDPYYRSEDRAVLIAENEADTAFDSDEYRQALRRGMRYKQWHTILDGKERETHHEVSGTFIGISEFFQVGDAEMLYPKDYINAGDHPEEYVNCRCSVEYIP